MANKVWKGGTDEDFNVAGNWEPSGIPANNDTIFGNDQAEKSCTLNMTQAGKTFGLIVERGFKFAFGSSGTPLLPDAFTTIIYAGSSIIPSYFKAASGSIAQVQIDSGSQQKNLVNLEGTILRINVRSGSGQVLTGGTVSGAINVKGGQGNTLAEFTVPSAVTLTGCDLAVSGGLLTVSSDCESVRVNSGEFVLDGGADLTTLLEVYDSGTFTWKAADPSGGPPPTNPSTITLADIFGGIFRTVKARVGRTLTDMNMYGSAVVDLEQGGHLITVTNPIRRFGDNAPRFPKGAKYTVSF